MVTKSRQPQVAVRTIGPGRWRVTVQGQQQSQNVRRCLEKNGVACSKLNRLASRGWLTSRGAQSTYVFTVSADNV